ncbi:hypothetical protein C8Q76DRAFT_861734, partial [Earliella scabrosa]
MSANDVTSHLQQMDGVELNIRSLDYLQITKYAAVIAFTFATLEAFSTLPDEVTYMWSSRLNPMKIIYFINKYNIFLDAGLGIHTVVSTSDPELCHARYQALAYCSVIGIMVSETILVTRTIALWNFNTYV